MLAYIGRRALLAVFTVWAISVLSFVIIQLPPGDYVTSYIAQMASMGSVVSDEEAQNLRIQYGIGQPVYVQYLRFLKGAVRGDFGESVRHGEPAMGLVLERLPATFELAGAGLLIALGLAIPAGIVSAVRRNTAVDYVSTVVALLGKATGSGSAWPTTAAASAPVLAAGPSGTTSAMTPVVPTETHASAEPRRPLYPVGIRAASPAG